MPGLRGALYMKGKSFKMHYLLFLDYTVILSFFAETIANPK